ncbi:MAG TPA: DUF5615 family PIN-like protein [Rubrivivax sp.]|nr:DUF5615 family PIN-like protein [Rubrivivax sp.]
MSLRFKLDENLPRRVEPALRDLGHDVETALSERLGGADDPVVLAACVAEGRILITLDLDFSDIRPICQEVIEASGFFALRTRASTPCSVSSSRAFVSPRSNGQTVNCGSSTNGAFAFAGKAEVPEWSAAAPACSRRCRSQRGWCAGCCRADRFEVPRGRVVRRPACRRRKRTHRAARAIMQRP